MINNTQAKAYTEVLEIISHFSEEEYNKIPKEKIEYYENNKDDNYFFKINPNIDLSKQNISQEANTILVLLFRDFFATDKQKEILNKLLLQNEQKLEEEKRKKYDPSNIFKNNNENQYEQKNEETDLMIIEEEKWYEKIYNFIRKLFKK